MTQEEPSVLRKVYFFRIEHFDDLKHDLPECLETILALPFHDQGRYQKDISDNILLTVYPDRMKYPLRLRFGKTRRDSLPDIERNGNLETLSLDEDAGLIDVCHIVIFDDGHVAAEFNNDGPRIRKLGDYLFMKGKNIKCSPKFLPLFERDIVSVINDLDSINLVEISVPPDSADLIRLADEDLASAIEAVERAGATKKIGLTLHSSATQQDSKLKRSIRRLAELIKSTPSSRERFGTLKASGFSSGSSVRRYIDLLEQQLISGEVFSRNTPKSRSLHSATTYEIIEDAYKLKRTKLKDAAVADDLW